MRLFRSPRRCFSSLPRRSGYTLGFLLLSTAMPSLGSAGCTSDGPATGDDGAGGGGEQDEPDCEIPSNFSWSASEELIGPVSDDGIVAIKDPTVVFFEDKWHIYATTANLDGEWSLAYLSFESWDQASQAPHYYMAQTPGFEDYLAAPHVFYFEPHEKWYLVFQTQPPKYSTTDDISDPTSWSEPQSFFVGKPRSAPELWIDYWVICDEEDCYLFFTADNGGFYRSQTKREDFPEGMSDPVLAMRMGTNDLFEGSATYKVKGTDQYLTLVEAIGPEGVRYYKAWLADRLDGAWTPIQNSFGRPFAGESNVSFEAEPWTRDISHGELLRDGYDERMIVDLCGGNMQFLFQGQDFEVGEATADYSQKPYRLGLLTQGPSDPELPPLDLPPTPAEPFPTVATGDNLLSNPGFEDGTTGWMGWGATLSASTERVRTGSGAAVASGRSDTWSGAAQDIFSKVEPGGTYLASFWVTVWDPQSPASVGADAGVTTNPGSPHAVSLTMKSTCGDVESYTSVASGETAPGEWVELSGTLDAPTCPDLAELILYAEGPPADLDLYVDDAFLGE